MIRQSSFAIHVTYTCPLACAHCCFSSNPQNRDALHVDHIRATLQALPNESDLRLVAFTGGEPFLLGKNLDSLVETASSRGFHTRVVTSAYWAKSPEKAIKRLKGLRDCGLNEMSISWDDFHEEFVSFDCVRNAFKAGKALGIFLAINTVQAARSRWTAKRIRTELGLDPQDDTVTCESSLNLTGRAKEQLRDAGVRRERTLGPCPYVITGPTLSAKNKLLACCGVIPETDQLIIDHDFRPENYREGVERAAKSILFNWIFLRGPYDVMEWIGKRYDIPYPSKQEVGGNCEACHRLFLTPEIEARVEDAVTEKAAEISGEINLLDALGWLTPNHVLGLWSSEMVVRDEAPPEEKRSSIPTYLPLAPVGDSTGPRVDPA